MLFSNDNLTPLDTNTYKTGNPVNSLIGRYWELLSLAPNNSVGCVNGCNTISYIDSQSPITIASNSPNYVPNINKIALNYTDNLYTTNN